MPMKDQVMENQPKLPSKWTLREGLASKVPTAHPSSHPTPMSAGSEACVYISSSVWRLKIEIISSQLCQPVLSLAPSPSTSQQAQGSHSWGLIKTALSHGFLMGWEGKDPLAPRCNRATSARSTPHLGLRRSGGEGSPTSRQSQQPLGAAEMPTTGPWAAESVAGPRPPHCSLDHLVGRGLTGRWRDAGPSSLHTLFLQGHPISVTKYVLCNPEPPFSGPQLLHL